MCFRSSKCAVSNTGRGTIRFRLRCASAFFNDFFGHAKEPWKAARRYESTPAELISQPSQLLQRPDGSVVWMWIVALRRFERGHGLLHVAEAGAKEAV